ncbi:RecQ family ATP-dependent DNA helicase [Auraticoccus monumenti]|uniref:ATP-dependent DNA helicase RecQ n=1 Tax=Auraticoccus monumenti TaxID=675864 RepID=A0A1G7CPX4_9ACTN|nr:RecQ family ATP-dependent DNA helicase [Auraticoccus monumenti]SDE41388.1 ATP-dependent DNA helicase RecQ [Auraticoccus monumenti]
MPDQRTRHRPADERRTAARCTADTSPDAVDRSRIEETARTVFGHELRDWQREAVTSLLGGRDVLLVQPTGAGKSLAYQLAGVLAEGGPTLVVSPLLALQADQVESLTQKGLRAHRLSSAEGERARAEALADDGGRTFLFLAPEQLAREETRRAVAALRPALVAVDEAHCVSSWGHDFRPDYLRLSELLGALGRPPVIALTATAAPPVRADVAERLGLHDPALVLAEADRPGIALSARHCHDESVRREAVLEAVAATAGQGLVYTRTRALAQELAAALRGQGREAGHYHAGMAAGARQRVQEDFMAGRTEVLVATSAFGMGIDKPDVRFVVHAQAPDSPDTYFQEVGRAGRDGQPATGLLCHSPDDFSLARFFAPAVPKPAQVAAVLGALGRTGAEEEGEVDRAALREATGLGERRLARILNLLAEERAHTDGDARTSLVEGVVARAEQHRTLQQTRIDMMRRYAETPACRQRFLLHYFGDEREEPCGRCDSCRSGSTAEHDAAQRRRVEEAGAEGAAWVGRFGVDQTVRHRDLGAGVVVEAEGDRLTVLFDQGGYRTLDAPTVVGQDLLEPV